MPWIPDVNPNELIESQWGNTIRDHVVNTFASAAERSSAIPAPLAGQVTHRADGNVIEYYTGTAWVPAQPVYDDVGTLGPARIRAGSRLGTTDAGGIMTIGLSPPLGTVLSFTAVVGDNLPAQLFKPVASQFVAGSTTAMWVSVLLNDAPNANTTTRINWTIIDRYP